jgi:hypothetical protein
MVDLTGIEPVIPACKAGVIPFTLQAHNHSIINEVDTPQNSDIVARPNRRIMAKIYSEEQRKDLVKKVDNLIDQGKSRVQALKDVGIAWGSYKTWKFGKSKKKKRNLPTVLSPQAVTIPHTEVSPLQTEEIVVLIGKPDSIVATIKKLYSNN